MDELNKVPAPCTERAEALLGPVEWIDATRGYLPCPGQHLHTSRNGRRDCVIYLDHTPTLHCLHGSCHNELEEKNTELRRILTQTDELKPRRMTADQKKQMEENRRRNGIRKRAAESRERILASHRWPLAEIVKASAVDLPTDASRHAHLMLQRFHPDDVVWIGDKYDSGKPEHTKHFRTIREWLETEQIDGPLLCPSTFKPGSYQRANEQIAARRFLVVESDTLGKDEVGAVFRWLTDEVKLILAAIVDTAGKSLHAWFYQPATEVVEDLKLVLPEIGCDPKLFTPSQPVRLPGALRDGRWQKLVYLGKENTI